MSWAQRDKASQETITFTDKGKLISYLDLEITLEKFKERKPLFNHNKELYISKEVKENALVSEGKSCPL